MTETISHPDYGDNVWNIRGTIGRPAPEYEVAVLRDDGSPVEPNETGELRVRGVPGVSLFAGYLHDKEGTAAAYDEQGWLRTGDRVTAADDGSIVFADRVKDMLKVGAENVSASEVERVIAGVRGVREVAGRWVPRFDARPSPGCIRGAGGNTTRSATIDPRGMSGKTRRF